MSSLAWAQEDFTPSYAGDPCGPLTVSYTPTVDPGRVVSGYLWDLGNGNTSTLEEPSASYVSAQAYTVSLTVQYNDGSETVTKTDLFEIFPRPTVSFTTDASGGCAPLTVNFTDESSAPAGSSIVTRLWEFEGGGSATGVTETVTFSSPGSYDVTLYVETDNGCSASFTMPDAVVIDNGVVPTFTPGSPQITCADELSVDFANTTAGTQGGGYAFMWDFGDGNTSTQAAPSHTYTSPGNYSVSLTLQEIASGCVGTTETKTNLVQLVDFEPGFSATPTTGCNPLSVQFTDTSSIQLDRQTVLWSFGDGSPIRSGTGNGAIRTPTHTYTQPGTYTVVMTIDDPAGACEGTRTVSSLITVPSPVLADFNMDQSLFCEDNFTVNFTNASTNAVSYQWDFGDGATSTQINPSHTYTANGVYPVTLTATAASGCTDVIQDTVYSVPLQARMVLQDDIGCAPLVTSFANASVGVVPITSYQWEVRDESNALVFSSTDENPTGVSLVAAGDYVVSLSIAAGGCTDVATDTLELGVPPISMEFSASDNAVCNGETVTFPNLTVEDGTNLYPVEYEWDYTGGGNFQPGNPRDGESVYANLDSGFYDVTLRYYSNGCIQELIKPDFIYVNIPRANFELFTDDCQPDSLLGTNLSVGEEWWRWEILDSTNAVVYSDTVARNLALSLVPGDTFMVHLTAYNDSVGCSDLFEEIITMPDALPLFQVGMVEDTVCVDQVLTVGTAAVADVYQWTFVSDSVVVTANGDTVSPLFTMPGTYDLTLSLEVNGCVLDTTILDAFIISDPLVRIGSDLLQGCAPLTVNFFDNSVSGVEITDRVWSLDSAVISTDSAFAFDFTSSRNPQSEAYTVSLMLTTAEGCVSTRSVDLQITDPVAEFQIDSAFVCEGTEISFAANEDPSMVYPQTGGGAYLWSTTASEVSIPEGANTAAVFPNGTHSVTLWVTDVNGCVDSVTQQFTVNRDLPEANFTANPTEVFCPPAAVNFLDESNPGSAGIAAWNWSFGGTSSSPLQNPVRIFRDPGQYTISLIITDSAGCRDTLVRESYIDIQGPRGSFTVDDTVGYEPMEVAFVGSSPDDQVTFLWDFANGQVEGYFEDSTYLYTYPSPGNFLPVMTVRDSRGCDYAPDPAFSIEVLPCPQVDLGPDFTLCTADSGQVLQGYNATHDISLGTLHYAWNTGDTTSSMVPGLTLGTTEYSLSIWVIDDEGQQVCERADTVAVTITPSPAASFTVDNACQGELSILMSTSTVAAGELVSFAWDFDGSGTYDTTGRELDSVAHIYASLGNFLPTLLVTTDSGCTDTAVVPVDILPVPEMVLTAHDTCQGLPVVFEVAVDQPVTQYSWDVDADGVVDQEGVNLTQASTAPDSSGVFEALATVLAENGCRVTDTITYEVYPLPILTFLPEPALLCAGESITVSASGAATYQWALDGSTNDALTVSPMQDTTFYAVTGTSDQGCIATDSVVVFVLNHPFLLPEARDCVGDTLFLSASIPGVSVVHTWNTGDTDSVLAVTEPGVYSVVSEVTEAGLACVISSETNVIFDPSTPIPLTDTTVCFEDVPEVVLSPGLLGDYLWLPSGFTDSEYRTSREDTVRLVFTNARGCVSDTTVFVMENCTPVVTFPNAFSPNGDGLNDVLLPKGQYFVNYHMEVYNRWGEVIFISDDPFEAWDGIGPDGRVYSTGVYFVYVRFANEFDPGETFSQRSRVKLVK